MANEYSINAKITADSTDFQEAVKKASKSLDGMKDSFNKATQNIKKSVADWGLDIDKFYNKGSKIFKDFGIDIDKFAAHFGTSGKVVAAITTASIALTKFGQAMNEARGELAKGTGAVGEDLIKLQDTFHKAMIEGVGRDAKEVGGMMADLNTRFGATEKELVDMTVQFDKFSSVMGVDARQAINDTADIMAKWGIETKNLNPLLDQLTTASQMSGASINELTSGLKQGQSVFSQFGMSATDSIAILSSLAKNGIETNSAITALKYSLNVFSKAGVDAKTGLNDTIEAITNAKTETEALSVACEIFGARNGVEMVKVLKSGSMSADEFKTALMNAGGALNATDKASRTSIDAISDLKATLTGTFAGFGEGFDSLFKDIIDSVSEAVRFLSPVIEPIGNIFRDVFSAIGEMLKVLVDNFIEFQKKYNDVFKAVAVTVQSAYKVIHSVLGNILEVFKTGFSLIFAILDGKWGLAWENAKKLALLFAKNLSDILSGIVNLFAKMINGVIEKLNSAIDLYHKLPKVAQIFDISNIEKISESNNLADSWGITSLLEETEKRIEELSGKAAEKITGDLGEVKEVTTEINTGIETQAMKVSQVVIDWSSKLTAQQISLLEKRRDEAVETAKLEKKSESEIFAIKQDFNKKIIALQTEQIEAQRKADIKKIEASKETLAEQKIIIAQINQYYDNQLILIQKNERLKVDEAKKSIKGMAESWDFYFADLKKRIEEDANDWTDVYKNIEDTVKGVATETLMSMGEALAGNGEAYEGFGATATKALSEVLKGLAAQLSALAAVNAATYNYGQAALAAAGAAAALVAAGTLAAVATNMTKTAEAAKDASTSIDTFVKSLREIWSGTVSSGSFVTSLTTMKVTITELRDSVESTTESLEEQKALMDRLLVAKDMDFTERWEGYYAAEKNVAQLSKELKDLNAKLFIAQGELNNARMHTIENQEKEIQFAKTEISVFEELYNSLKKIPKAIYGDVKYALQQNFDILKNEQKKSLLDVQKSLYTDMSNMGKDLGKTLVDGIKNGTKTADFMESIKDYIRNKIIELTVYTDDFNDKLAEIGAKLSSAIASGMTDDVKKLSGEIESLYKESTETAKKAVEAMGLSLKEEVKNSSNNNDVKKEFSAEGTTLGETFITSLINGAKKEDFSKTLGSYMKEQLIRATVYTDAFKEKMDVFGKKLVASAGNKSVIKDLKKDIESLFSDKSKSIQNMTAYIDTLFELGEVATETESKFKIAMKSFKDSVMDLGADIANNFVSSLSGGLNVDSALLGFKKFLRDYIIKAYVFTDSMKGEIEKIGSLIGKTLDGSISKKELSDVANAVKATYGKLADSMKTVDAMLDEIFGKEAETKTASSSNTVTENVSKIQKAIDNLKDSLKDLGGDVAGNFISSLNSGLDLDSALISFKKFIRNYVIQSAVYTDSLKSEMEKIGQGIADYIMGKNGGLNKISNEFKKTYEKLAGNISKADEYLDKIFGKEKQKEVKDTGNTITKELSKIESAMDSFKKTVSDLGGDVAGNFISSLNSGLDVDSALISFKKFIRNYVIQASVYTESLKTEMESLGKGIADYISGKKGGLDKIGEDFKKTYEKLAANIKKTDEYLDKIFGKEAEKNVSSGASTVVENVSKIQKAIDSLKDSLADMGGDVASNLISSLSSGLDVNSALINFKKFLREYIIKSYVYTESMKGEIEKIGEKIASALSGNLTESRLDRISYDVKKTYNKLSESLKTVDKTLDDIFGKETKTTSSANTVTDNVSTIQKAIDNLKDSLADLGGDVASNFISSLNSGLDLDSALISFKKFIRNYVVQTSVYTESLKDEFSKIGDRVWHYVAGSYPKSELNNIKKTVSSIYGNLAESLKGVDEVLDEIFGKEAEKEVKDTGDTITKELSKIESAMDSFKKTVADLGGDIASNLIDGLSNGLSQSDFLTNMKNWIKKMLVQSVVYTEQMKSQIEEIGKAISSAISGGFTETSMHEIRRDLSYIFEQATSKISGIDKILGGVFDGYASGTTSALSGLHIVGERGPELVRFKGGERVYNNADTMKMIAGAGKTNNFNVTFNNLQDTSAFAMMNQLKQYNREMAINGVI